MADSRKVKLTKAIIEKMNPPLSGRVFAYDSSISGLCICLTSAGTQTWYLYRKVNRRPVRLKLGRYPEITPEAARQLATQAAGRMATGEDIQAARVAKRKGETTWGQLFDQYLEEHAKIHKKSWREDQAYNDRDLKDWKNRPLSFLSRPVIADKHREIGLNGTVAANRVLSLVSKVFNFAVEAGIWDRPNPCRGIKKFKEKSRDRFVQADEMPRLLEAIRNYSDEILRDYFLMCLMTGARRANVFSMAWEDIDLQAGIWRIPDTKSGQSVLIALPKEAQELLLRHKITCGHLPWVFPGRGRKGHLVEPKKAWQCILKKSGLQDLKIHDLRRTLGSWQAAAGVSLSIIGKSLGHKTTSATAIYARMNLDPVRETVGAAVRAMLEAGKSSGKSSEKPQHPGVEPDEKPIRKSRKKNS